MTCCSCGIDYRYQIIDWWISILVVWTLFIDDAESRPCGSKWLRLAFKLLVCWWNSRTGFVELFHSLVLSMFEVKEGPRHISKCQMQLLSTTLFADYMQSCTCIRVSNVLFLGIVIAWVFGHCHLIDICIHYIQYKQYIQYIFIYSIHMYLHMHTYIYIYTYGISGLSVNMSSFSIFALRNGVLNNARDDTLVIDVKIDRIAWGGRSQIAGGRWKRSERLQPVDLQWTERLYNYFGSTPPPSNGGNYWRFRGIPYSKCKNPGVCDCYWFRDETKPYWETG